MQGYKLTKQQRPAPHETALEPFFRDAKSQRDHWERLAQAAVRPDFASLGWKAHDDLTQDATPSPNASVRWRRDGAVRYNRLLDAIVPPATEHNMGCLI
jgi:hypothetical protein